MEGNPYIELISLMKEAGQQNSSSGFCVGTVTSEIPLIVNVGGIHYEEGDLIKMVYGAVSGYGELTFHPRSGEDVLLLPYDNDQRMVLLGKVVGI